MCCSLGKRKLFPWCIYLSWWSNGCLTSCKHRNVSCFCQQFRFSLLYAKLLKEKESLLLQFWQSDWVPCYVSNKVDNTAQLAKYINSLAPINSIWRRRPWSTIVWVMACFLTVPNHKKKLNQCWQIIIEAMCHLRLGISQIICKIPIYGFSNHFTTRFNSPMGRWLWIASSQILTLYWPQDIIWADTICSFIRSQK